MGVDFGNETDYRKIEKVRKQILDKFPEAFIIAFVGNVKMTAKEALKLKANNSKVNK
jgi:N-acetylmuramoyl-L-alanine amidase